MATLRPYEMRLKPDSPVIAETEVWSPIQDKWVEFSTFYMHHDAAECVRRWNALIGVGNPDGVPALLGLLRRLSERRVATVADLHGTAVDVQEILSAFEGVRVTDFVGTKKNGV